MSAPLLIVPGYNNSGPQHWQSHWERLLPGALRVQQRDWDHPTVEEWVAALDAAIATCGEPPVLVTHSLGGSTVAHWAIRHRRAIRGALLVAPPDLDSPALPSECLTFTPIPRQPLPFRSILIASRDDPYASFERSEQMARDWGSRLVDAGPTGHINSASGLGEWPWGQALLRELL
ncbi:alpha/beta hydrolase [Vitiosangium sp. GDMCC 1.1324]|uniref:RBBP9/YdeN family alpha/beta hydrolase n=1 Tax=Vitiosangium sp. (strain GDMCC 1.1324) TaxID=2138576 RepID=UPI000D34E98B|nr:alpha/beta hydrolase [Vitiosangium sp. GDMCC 1.1324]PTL76891.1 alpha/beta hydrolase [Vitiosangium sp. GDMCC 1.1324]